MTAILPHRSRFMARLAGIAFIAMLAWGTLVTGTMAWAAEEGAASSPPAEEPTRLSTADIDQRSDAVRARLSDAQKAIDAEDFEIDVLTGELDEFEAGIQEVTVSIDKDLETFNPLVVDRMRQTLASQETQAEAWNAEFSTYLEQLAAARSALLADAEFFDEILTSEQAADLPTVLAEKITVLRQDVDNVRDALANKLNELVTLRVRIAGNQAGIDAAREQLEKTVYGRKGRIVSRGAEPLHKALRGPFQSPIAAFDFSREILVDTATEYASQHRDEIIFVALMLPLLFLLVWSVRSASLKKADSSIHESARSIFVHRPIAAALVIWLAFGPELLTRDLPSVLSDLVGSILIIATFRLLPLVVRPKLIGPVRGLLILTLVTIVSSIIYEAGPVHRLITVGASIAAIFILMTMVRSARAPSTEGRPPFKSVVLWVSRVGIVLLVIAVLGEFYGASRLAERFLFVVLLVNIVTVVVLATELVLRTGWEVLLDSDSVSQLNGVRRHPMLVHRRGIFIIRLLLAVFVITLLPDLFPLVDFFTQSINELVTEEWVFGNIRLSIGTVLALLVGLTLAIYIPRFIRFILDEDIVPRLPVDPGAGAAATRLTFYVLVLVGIGLALASAGFEFGQVALIIGALGVGIGFGLQNIVNDFVSGIVVAFERPFQVGDTIEVGQLWGRVRSIGLRASTIRTYEGAEVIVPNAGLISGQVINWTLSDRRRRIDIPVGVEYGSDPEQVQEILEKAVTGHPACLDDPPPKALFREFGESSLNFELRFWTPDAETRLDTTSDIAIKINAALKAAGITIPFPQRDLHVRSGAEKDISID